MGLAAAIFKTDQCVMDRACKIRTWLIVLVSFGLTVGLWLLRPPPHEEYAHWDSPDGRYRVTVWRDAVLFAMPGQGSDAPGTVSLTDWGGRELFSTPLEMVQLASLPQWQPGRVSMKLIFDWPLEAGE